MSSCRAARDSYFYDEVDRLMQATNLAGTTTLHQYSYDAVGNRQTKLGSAGTTSYSYESLEGLVVNNRLDAATAPEARDYHHDVYGNRDYAGADPYDDTPSLLYDEANRLVEVRDAADSFATTATYTYDAFGRRVKKVVGDATVLYFYDTEGHLIGEVQKLAAADLSRTYVFLEDELMAVIDKTKEVGTQVVALPLGPALEIDPRLLFGALLALAGIGAGLATRRAPVGIATTTSGAALLLLCAGTPQQPRMAFVHVDPLGTPIAITNAPATWNANNPAKVVWKASYEPFGKATVNEDPDGDTATFPLNVRFPGQIEDAETGYYYNMFRYYDPSVGRYTSPDPVGQPPIRFLSSAAIWTSGVNPYAYALTNPLRLTDPLGLYGTGSCDYYSGRCDESAGDYCCRIAPSFCQSFPDFGSQDPDPTRDDDFEGWSRCTRQCLQDCDADQNADQNKCPREPDPATDEFTDLGATECHAQCYLTCWAWGAFAPDPRR